MFCCHILWRENKEGCCILDSLCFIVEARDSGARPFSGTAIVLCSVLDDNDNPPEFMQSSLQICLPENLPPGVIHTVQASDPDHGENGTIHYSILGKEPACGSVPQVLILCSQDVFYCVSDVNFYFKEFGFYS